MQRASGILLHITSLPSPYGIGDLGPQAYRWLDVLAQTKQKYWQILPINPTDAINYHSPYSCSSAFAGNTLLISLEQLAQEGLLKNADMRRTPKFSAGKVDYRKVLSFKKKILAAAYQRFAEVKKRDAYEQFCLANAYWLNDFVLFAVIKNYFKGTAWSVWPAEMRQRDPAALKKAEKRFSRQIEEIKFYQYIFFKQWSALKKYSKQKGINVIGDIPIYVNYDSADTWTHQDLFKIGAAGELLFVGGVPPDYFSATGQRWGNPVYRWDRLQEKGYAWWVKRLAHNLEMFDYVRIDHFRGFLQYWEIPAGEKTAVHGRWVDGPKDDFFKALLQHFPQIPIIAEDMGIITPDVTALMERFGFPGMKVLLFGFGDDMQKNPYLPHNFGKNCVVYTGTHDNNTVAGWLKQDAKSQEKINLAQYLGYGISESTLPWDLTVLAMRSSANAAIIPVQDILGLGQTARMNTPGTLKGNWQWRLELNTLTPALLKRFRELTDTAQRSTDY